MRLLLHFARYGPYHHARLRAVAEELSPLGWEVIGLQTASTDATYDWREQSSSADNAEELAIMTVFPGRLYEAISAGECRRSLITALDHLSPDAIAVPGWGTLDARISLGWCRRRGAKAVIMSETREVDGLRRWWKEHIKSLMLRHVHGAIVGGAAHRDYLVKLGIPAPRIVTGYNVVDNAYFAAEAARWRGSVGGSSVGGGQSERLQGVEMDGAKRSQLAVGGDSVGGRQWAVGGEETVGGRQSERLQGVEMDNRENRDGCPARASEASKAKRSQSAVGGAGADGGAELPQLYFLASNRFIERKNLVRLIDAYAQFCQQLTADSPPLTADWSLCLLGDGLMKPWLMTRCRDLGLKVVESGPWELETSNLKPEPSFQNRRSQTPTSATVDLQAPETGPLTADSQPPTESPPTVYFPGFRQIEELPRFYAHAGAFIHPALEEPWGLVINEAMACGLPVLSGDNVGAAAELICEGVNGWTFDATDVAAMAEAMGRVAALSEEERLAMGRAGAARLEERCPTQAFASGLRRLLE
jgi:glycosyltransferase involved in cell wall biosynthesis